MKAKGRTALVALVTVFALSVVSVSAASERLPEFSSGTKQAFTSKIIGPITLEAKSGEIPLDCAGGKTVGEIVNTTQVGKVVVTLTGCGYGGPDGECTSSGKSSGEVVTSTLKGELGESGKTVVLGLEPEKAGAAVAVYTCGLLNVTVKGGLIGQIEPIGKVETKFKQVWEGAAGVQRYTSFEGSSTKTTRSLHLDYSVNGKEAEEAAVNAEEELTFENRIEIT
jgi:hypothetical protein